MSRIPSFLLGVATGAVLLLAVMNFHVVRSSEGYALIAKRPARLSETYIDIRSYGMTEWVNHPQLASALVQANKQHLVSGSAVGSLQESVNQLWPDGSTR